MFENSANKSNSDPLTDEIVYSLHTYIDIVHITLYIDFLRYNLFDINSNELMKRVW